jgi:hypothetical protein
MTLYESKDHQNQTDSLPTSKVYSIQLHQLRQRLFLDLPCQEYAYVIGASVKTLIKGAGVLPHHHHHYNNYHLEYIKNSLNIISLASI